MTATADMIIAQRKARRALTFWRILAIGALVIAVIALLPRGTTSSGPHVARIAIEGVITDEPKRERMIRALAENDDVRALVVDINSPGGTVTGSESLYEAIRHVAEAKPVVSVMGEYAASGGYITAIAGEHIVARGNTLTGSIGVVAQVPNVEGLLEMLGVEVTQIKSAPLKAEPNFTSSPTPEALKAQEDLILDMFAWFEGLVADRRALTGAALAEVTDGRAFTGRQALTRGLVDALGDEDTARDWLAEKHEISTDLPAREHDWREPERPWPLSELNSAGAALSRIEG
ncbi:MAG: signal peptide peptidase SppA, partial [Paracoccaceae bacterium]